LEHTHTHRSTLDETELLLLDYSLNSSLLNFYPFMLAEFFTIELEVVCLVVYHLAPVFHVCVCLGTSKCLGVGMFDKRLNIRILYVFGRMFCVF